MADTIIERLAEFTANCTYKSLPDKVSNETKRILIDSIGCGLAATDEPKGKIGIDIGYMMGGDTGAATILGTGQKTSIFGAAFANGELINALDFDAILPPGHVSPYVIPAAMALAEAHETSGADLVTAVAVAHEMSNRIGKAMDYLRETKNGVVSTPKVLGYSCTIFGATAAALKVKGVGSDVIAHALGIAGCITPVNSHMAWVNHAPSTTVKYTVAGVLVQNALTAAAMGELGHRGDIQVLDDPEYGYAAMIGTSRWEPKNITDKLGNNWGFVAQNSFKPYPHCRVLHSIFDAMIEVLDKNNITHDEIENIRAFGEGFVERPIWLNQRIEHVQDGQFSITHGLALAAHRVRPGKAWQNPELVFKPSVINLMKRVTHEAHPDYVKLINDNSASRPARIEIHARGRIFVGERRYPKGSPSPDPSSYMTTDELCNKFRHNAEDVLSQTATEDILDALLNLERVDNFSSVMRIFNEGNTTRAN